VNELTRAMVGEGRKEQPQARLTSILQWLMIQPSTWYHAAKPPNQRQRPGPAPRPIPALIESAVVAMAATNPWYGYKRIAVMCRRAGTSVTNRQCYQVMKRHGLLRKRRVREAELYQAAKLFELLPTRPNELWQMDVTYVHIPGFGWWYAVTVIDYYSRYLLALHLTPSYSALAATEALALARREAERLCGPLARPPFLVTDNGSSFIARRFVAFTREDYRQVRIRYRTPTQLGLLERFHRTLKEEEVYWRLYDSPAHARTCLAEFRERYNRLRPHWALVPESGGDPANGTAPSASTGPVLPCDPATPEEVYLGQVTPQVPRWQGWARAAKEKLDKLTQAAA
jgi:putative transposase